MAYPEYPSGAASKCVTLAYALVIVPTCAYIQALRRGYRRTVVRRSVEATEPERPKVTNGHRTALVSCR